MTVIASGKPQRPLVKRCLGVVLNLISVEVKVPIQLIPRHVLRRPTLEEVEHIRKYMKRFANDNRADYYIRLLESRDERTPEQITAVQNEGFVRSNNPDDWRYWVVEVTNDVPGGQ